MADIQKLADASEVIVQGYAFIDRGEGHEHSCRSVMAHLSGWILGQFGPKDALERAFHMTFI